MAHKQERTYQLGELTAFIGRVLALNLPNAIWVKAEIVEANTSRGHRWLTLAQREGELPTIAAQCDAVVWKSQLARLHRRHGLGTVRSLLREGFAVRLQVSLSYHDRYGFRLVVEDIDPDHTLGELARAREATLQRLRAKGLTVKNKRLPSPAIIQRVAVISSETAAGWEDFREQLANNPWGYSIRPRLFPAVMQGLQTTEEVSARLRKIAKWPEGFDAVAIVRGGGARADLAAFDNEDLATAIANYPLPVFTGIGHETDVSVVDVVAHQSLKTPTALAAYLIDLARAADASLEQLGRLILEATDRELRRQEFILDGLRSRILQAGSHALVRQEEGLASITLQLRGQAERGMVEARRDLIANERLLAALRPDTTLRRGFALVTQEGRVITEAKMVSDAPVLIHLNKGKLRADLK